MKKEKFTYWDNKNVFSHKIINGNYCVEKLFWDNGNLHSHHNYKLINNKVNGIIRHYCVNGKINSYSKVINNKKQGIRIRYINIKI